MNEMLGNQYYLAGRYSEAKAEFEKVLVFDPDNYKVKKKLVVCYISTGEIDLALKLFTLLLKKNYDLICEGNPMKEKCPCSEMIYDLEHNPKELSDLDYYTALGILWTYCQAKNAIPFFKQCSFIEPENETFKNIINTINNHLSTKNKEVNHGKERTVS